MLLTNTEIILDRAQNQPVCKKQAKQTREMARQICEITKATMDRSRYNIKELEEQMEGK